MLKQVTHPKRKIELSMIKIAAVLAVVILAALALAGKRSWTWALIGMGVVVVAFLVITWLLGGGAPSLK